VKYREVKISPDGKQATFLFDDGSPLLNVGEPTLVRASNVRFDNSDKLWYVFVRRANSEGTIEEQRLDAGWKTRKEAIDYEIQYCELMLKTEANTVDHLIAAHVQSDGLSG
jgi:hypothetical protein